MKVCAIPGEGVARSGESITTGEVDIPTNVAGGGNIGGGTGGAGGEIICTSLSSRSESASSLPRDVDSRKGKCHKNQQLDDSDIRSQ